MQLVRYADTVLKTRGVNHRVGTFRYKDLGEGIPGTPGNFFLRMVWSEADFFSPRHLHNFDQVRVQIEGNFNFSADGVMKPGTIGYFPEGTAYGPQTSQDDTVQLVMQIGGTSGNGYISEAQRIEAVDQLCKTGHFSEGRYFARDSTDRKGMDGFQAAWEQAQGKKMIYPSRRFQKPILMNPGAIGWTTLPGIPGVERRPLWNFGTRTVGADAYNAQPGSTHTVAGPASCFVEQGTGRVESAGVKDTFSAFDVIHLTAGESATLTPAETARLLILLHPVF